MDVNPGIAAVTDASTGDSLLDVALGECNASPGCSGRVLRLLVHQEVTRARSLDHKRQRRHPLHMACYRRTMDPEQIGRLVDLDPDVLTFRVPNTEEVPLHFALATNLTSISAAAAVQKMVGTRPDTLLCRDYRGRTPVAYALERLPHNRPQHEHDPAAAPPEAAASDDDAAEKAAEASFLRGLVALRPGSVVPIGRTAFMDDRPDTALWMACAQYHDCPNLIGEIIRAYPPALCVASVTTRWNLEPSRLPLEAVAVATTTARPPQTRGRAVSPAPLDVEEETLHMALAVVEYVIGTTASSFENPSAAGFRRHVADTVAAFLSSADDDEADPIVGSSSGFAVAKALHRRVAGVGRRRRPVVADLLRALFCQGDVPRLLRGNDAVRDAVMGRTAIDLYRMNRRGRFFDDDPDTLSAADRLSAAHRHVDLVKLVCDNVECVYLHVRDHWVYLLPQSQRQQA